MAVKNPIVNYSGIKKELQPGDTIPVVLPSAQSIGDGTAYTLTDTPTAISFGTTGDLSVSIPSAGTYEITANVQIGMSSSTAETYNITVSLNDGSPIANTERAIAKFIDDGSGSNVSIDISSGKNPSWIITTVGAATIKLFAVLSASVAGKTIASDSVGRTTLAYKKLS